MTILMNIRKFLGLDKAIVALDNDLVNATGLIIVEKKDFMQPEPVQSCFGPMHDISSVTHPGICPDHSPGDLHLSNPLHIG